MFTDSFSVAEIDPVDGWALRVTDQQDGDGFWYCDYVARSEARDHSLQVSRYNFIMTQDRFTWLVRNGFPQSPKRGGAMGPWTDESIDAAMAADRRAMAA